VKLFALSCCLTAGAAMGAQHYAAHRAEAAQPAVVSPAIYAPPGDCRKVRDDELSLVCTVYFEARNQPMLGQIAVAKTVLMRVHDPRFPKTLHEIVWQKWPSAQYTWTVDPKIKDTVVHDAGAWRRAVEATKIATLTRDAGVKLSAPCDLDKVARYHEKLVEISWNNYRPVCTIGDHVFYVEKRVKQSSRN
jgi:spore germination cell wall hydrolase CwlJ-like protein